MGLGLEETIIRYTNRQATLSLADAVRVAKPMGLGTQSKQRQAAAGGDHGN